MRVRRLAIGVLLLGACLGPLLGTPAAGEPKSKGFTVVSYNVLYGFNHHIPVVVTLRSLPRR